jgi:hypothetical protein
MPASLAAPATQSAIFSRARESHKQLYLRQRTSPEVNYVARLWQATGRRYRISESLTARTRLTARQIADVLSR